MSFQTVFNHLLGNYKVEVETQGDGSQRQVIKTVSGLAPAAYDEIVLGYTGTDLTTVTYKLAGATVGTLTLAYAAPGGNLTSVTRT